MTSQQDITMKDYVSALNKCALQNNNIIVLDYIKKGFHGTATDILNEHTF